MSSFPAPVQSQRRPLGGSNPNLFKPPPPSKSPKPSDGRRVSFRDTVEDIDDPYNASPKIPPKDAPASTTTSTTPVGGAAATAKTSKWQPLSSVDPNPIVENDPFSLGDSDDEREAGGSHRTTGSREIKMEDAERLRQATADAMAESLVDEDKVKAGKGEGKSGEGKSGEGK